MRPGVRSMIRAVSSSDLPALASSITRRSLLNDQYLLNSLRLLDAAKRGFADSLT